MRFTLALSSLVTVVAALPSASGFASEEAACEPLIVHSTERERHFVDVDGDGGVSGGDQHVGQRVLVDADGQQVGDRFWIASIDEVSEQGKEIGRVSQVVVVLEEGTIFMQKSRVAGVDQPTRVTGGTGIYAGVGGTETIDHDGPKNTYHLALECPDTPQS